MTAIEPVVIEQLRVWPQSWLRKPSRRSGARPRKKRTPSPPIDRSGGPDDPQPAIRRSGPAAPGAHTVIEVEIRNRPPFPLHDGRLLQRARSRCGDRAGTWRMAPESARAIAVYQLAALTIGGRLAGRCRRLGRPAQRKTPERGDAGVFKPGDRLGDFDRPRNYQTAPLKDRQVDNFC